MPIFSLLSVYEDLSIAQISDRGHEQNRDREKKKKKTLGKKKSLFQKIEEHQNIYQGNPQYF